MCCVKYEPVGTVVEEEAFQAGTEAATSRCEVLHQMSHQTFQGKRSERRTFFSLLKNIQKNHSVF